MVAIKGANEVSVTYTEADFKGLLLALDPRAVDKPFVLDGRNFLLDANGPYSAFSNKIMTYSQLQAANGFSFRVGTDAYECISGGIFKFDTNTSRYYPVYSFTDDGTQWPWTLATCGNKYFFCRKGVGVIMFDPLTSIWTKLVTAIPNDPRAVTQSFGRLVVVGATQTGWSALDDGTSFTPDLVTGAGFQGHSVINGVAAGMMCKQINNGVLIYTDHGCYVGQISLLGTSPFRWFAVDRGRVPVNPFCFADIDDTTHVILDKKGLYQTTDGTFAEYDPLMSEYIRTKVFPQHLLWIDNPLYTNNLRLSYAKDLKFFFIHIARDGIAPLYDMAFVKYIPKAEWGRFDYQHYFVGELSFTTGSNLGFNFGFVDQYGYFRKFISDIFVETSPQNDNVFWYTPRFEIPYRQQAIQAGAAVNVGASNLHLTDYSEALFQNNINDQPGSFSVTRTEFLLPTPLNVSVSETTDLFSVLFEMWDILGVVEDWSLIAAGTADEDWGNSSIGQEATSQISFTSGALLQSTTQYIAQSQPLNSYINVGLLHFEIAEYDDELGCLTNIMIGADAIPGDTIIEDYASENNAGFDIVDDLVTDSGFEDWGISIALATAFDLSVIGTQDDGETIFQQETPNLEFTDAGAQYYTCQTNGVYHQLTLSAFKAGQTFHLKLLAASGFMAGRL